MRTKTNPWIRHSAVLSAIAVALLMAAPAAAADPPPINRTYLLLLFGQIDVSSTQLLLSTECMTVTETEMCLLISGICGDWSFTDVDGKESGIAFGVAGTIGGLPGMGGGGVPGEIDGQMRIDDRGKKHSMGGAARLQIPGRKTNYALAARPMSLARCENLVSDFAELMFGAEWPS